jgi:hypothetical protein
MKKIFLLNICVAFIYCCFSRQDSGSQFINQLFSSHQKDDLIGSWSLVMHTFDNNNNGKLDDEERKKGDAGRHFYQFNADGTCLIHTMKLKGWYELKTVDGKKRLFTYADDEGKRTPENEWYFISVSKTELVLLSKDKFTFWIYKRG